MIMTDFDLSIDDKYKELMKYVLLSLAAYFFFSVGFGFQFGTIVFIMFVLTSLIHWELVNIKKKLGLWAIKKRKK